MSPLPSRLVVDNSVVSSLHEAGALSRVLELWPGQWLVPLQVRTEAAAWPSQGHIVTSVLDELERLGVIEYAAVDPLTGGGLYARLQRTLGQGEAAAMTIASYRHLGVAIDDLKARKTCNSLNPPIPWLATEQILGWAVTDGLLTRADAEAVWRATNIRDPNRFVP